MQENYHRHQISDFLTKHLKTIRSTRNHILKEFYEEHTGERDAFKGMMDQYLDFLKGFIDANPEVSVKQRWPLILIGSVAEVQDLDYSEIERLKIVPPFYGDGGGGLDCASCLSPVGYALLFKGVGDRVTVDTPLGNCRFMIKSVELPPV
ncbi:MAG TPA: GreA/GreB family elongation factor [Clostridia bacterium]|nr:GreA/GreB family elongation factor [Clostridia bacterium]